MGTYKKEFANSTVYKYTLTEQYIYGSSREGNYANANIVYSSDTTVVAKTSVTTLSKSSLRFELTDHLGNVRAVVTGVLTNTGNATIASLSDYYPFGSEMPGRQFTASGGDYRYGFNGKEKDDDWSGEGNMYDYGERMYDPRIARFFMEDPFTEYYSDLTPYQYAGNNPIRYIDLDGLEQADPLIFIGQTAKRNVLAQNSIDLLYQIVKDVGLDNLTITSTGRTPEDQARIMFENLRKGTSSSYGKPGRKVIALYKKLNNEGLSDDDIKSKMTALIKELGPGTVSKHCADPTQVNAIDIPMSFVNDLGYMKKKKLFDYLEQLEKDKVLNRFLHPGNNPGEAAYHIEVPVDNTPKDYTAEINALNQYKNSYNKFVIQNDNTTFVFPLFPMINNNDSKKPNTTGQNINYSEVDSEGKVFK